MKNIHIKQKLLLVFCVVGSLLSACSDSTIQPQQRPATVSNTEHADSSSAVKNKPNILFIMTDDHAFQAIGAYGSTINKTPNIDRIANEGMRFDRSYVSNSICSPSRAVTLTGKLSHLNSVTDNIDVFDNKQVTYPKLLQENGYQTAVIGKWHLKSAPTGFDFWQVLPDQGHYYDPEFLTAEGKIKEEGYVTDVITKRSIDYLKNKRDKSKPFMLMYQHKAPHRQWWPDQEELSALSTKHYPEPESLFDDYQNRGRAAKEAEMRIGDHMALSADNKIHPDVLNKAGYSEFMDWYEEAYLERYNRLSKEQQLAWDKVYWPINADFADKKPQGKALTQWKYQRYLQDYIATIDSVDRNIGELLNYLDESGLAENTLVIYTSDQGFYLGEHGWFDKRLMYEESFRTPLIIRWPNHIVPGSNNKNLVQNIDYAPTMLAIADVDIPKEMQGKSLVPLLSQQKVQWRDALYYHYYEYPSIHMVKRHYGVRTERYKLIHFYYDIDEWELYDLQQDPQEMNNVFSEPAYTKVKQQMQSRLMELRNQYQDSDELTQSMLVDDLTKMENRRR